MNTIKNLRRVREDKGMSLRDLGADLKVDHSLVSYWERGLRSPSKENKLKLEKYFEEDVEYLLGQDAHANHTETMEVNYYD